MALGNDKVGGRFLPRSHNLQPDPRYQDIEFRKSQAERYLDHFTNLSVVERRLIPRLCYWEIRKLQAWRGLTRIEQIVFKACNPFFSRIPNDNYTTLKIFGASMLTIGSFMYSAYTSNDKLLGVTAIGFFAFLFKEMYLKTN